MGSVKISENGLKILNDRVLSSSIANAIIRGREKLELGQSIVVTNIENAQIGTIELATRNKRDKELVSQ